MRSVSALAVLVAVLFARPVVGQETTREDFKRWCSQLEGRWIGDYTFVTDWPGGGKKGDKVTAYWQGRVCEDGNVMVTNFFGGANSSTGVAYYDEAEKQIHHTYVSSGGTVFQQTLWPDGNNWRNVTDITLPDGTKGSTNRDLVFTNSGNTLTRHINGHVGDDVIKDQKDVWRRVSKRKATDLSLDTASSAAQVDDSENITKELRQLSNQWTQAFINKDLVKTAR